MDKLYYEGMVPMFPYVDKMKIDTNDKNVSLTQIMTARNRILRTKYLKSVPALIV